jgi:hypothetical protein
MSNYTPPVDFVSRVMKDVRAYESRQEAQASLLLRLLEFRSFRWLLSLSAAGIGALNILRIYLALFAPAVCR